MTARSRPLRADAERNRQRDVDLREVMALAMGAVAASRHHGIDARGRERLLAIMCDGLRAG